jgi:MOSC domain-containing protein YiiM
MSAVLERGPDDRLIRKAGVMGVVLAGGVVCPGDPIRVKLPVEPHRRLEPV